MSDTKLPTGKPLPAKNIPAQLPELPMKPLSICIQSDGNVTHLLQTLDSIKQAVNADPGLTVDVHVFNRRVPDDDPELLDEWQRSIARLAKTSPVNLYELRGSALSSLIDWGIKSAKYQHVLCTHAGVRFAEKSLARLAKLYGQFPRFQGLIHGVYCDLAWQPLATTILPAWIGLHFGVLDVDGDLVDIRAEMQPIPMGDMQMFAVRKDSWLGFANGVSGEYGLAGPIHEKFRLFNQHVWCLPFFRWNSPHHPWSGETSANADTERLNNLVCGFYEIGLPHEQLVSKYINKHGRKEVRLPQDVYFRLMQPEGYLPRPLFTVDGSYVPFMGYAIDHYDLSCEPLRQVSHE